MRVFGRVAAQSPAAGQCKKNMLFEVTVYTVTVTVYSGAREWGRTITALRPPDFESGASASSATRAREKDSTGRGAYLCMECWALYQRTMQEKQRLSYGYLNFPLSSSY